MKIATWNVERLKHKKMLGEIASTCQRLQADILVLTETDERIRLDYRHCLSAPTPPDISLPRQEEPVRYEPTEHRVSIYTNYECVRQRPTFDRHTSLCAELATEMGNILVYGTIIGILGNRHPSFEADLKSQTADFKRLSSEGGILCVCGDFNCSFADGYYFTYSGRSQLLKSFSENRIRLLTGDRPSRIDHVAVSEDFVAGRAISVTEWNLEKSLSDHKGIAVNIV